MKTRIPTEPALNYADAKLSEETKNKIIVIFEGRGNPALFSRTLNEVKPTQATTNAISEKMAPFADALLKDLNTLKEFSEYDGGHAEIKQAKPFLLPLTMNIGNAVRNTETGQIEIQLSPEYAATLPAEAVIPLQEFAKSICEHIYRALLTPEGNFPNPELLAFLNQYKAYYPEDIDFMEKAKRSLNSINENRPYTEAEIQGGLSASVTLYLVDDYLNKMYQALGTDASKAKNDDIGGLLVTYFNDLLVSIRKDILPAYEKLHTEENRLALQEELASANESVAQHEAALFTLLQSFMEDQTNIIAATFPAQRKHELNAFQDISPSEHNALQLLLNDTELFLDHPTFKARYADNPAFKELKVIIDAVLEQKAALNNKDMSMSEKLAIVNKNTTIVDDGIKTFKAETDAIKALTAECEAYEDALTKTLRPVMEKATKELAKRVEKMEATLASEKSAFAKEQSSQDNDNYTNPREAVIAGLEKTLKPLKETLADVTTLNNRYAAPSKYIVVLNSDSGLNIDKATREGLAAKILAAHDLKQTVSLNSKQTNRERLVAFNENFKTAEQTLSKNLDSATKKFLSAVLIILKSVASLGIYAVVRATQSKKETGTAKFWKTPEQIAARNIKRTMDRDPDAAPPTKKPKR